MCTKRRWCLQWWFGGLLRSNLCHIVVFEYFTQNTKEGMLSLFIVKELRAGTWRAGGEVSGLVPMLWAVPCPMGCAEPSFLPGSLLHEVLMSNRLPKEALMFPYLLDKKQALSFSSVTWYVHHFHLEYYIAVWVEFTQLNCSALYNLFKADAKNLSNVNDRVHYALCPSPAPLQATSSQGLTPVSKKPAPMAQCPRGCSRRCPCCHHGTFSQLSSHSLSAAALKMHLPS